MDTRTISSYSTGKTYTVSGDAPSYIIHHDGTQTPATPEQARDIQREEIANRLIEREVRHVDSSLVEMLIEKQIDGFNTDDIQNLTIDASEWDIEECIEWLDDEGHDIDEDDREDVDALRDQIRDNAEPREVFEWWRVTPWLARHLNEMGQPVIDNEYGEWWGRTTTGQMIILDGVIQAVADRII